MFQHFGNKFLVVLNCSMVSYNSFNRQCCGTLQLGCSLCHTRRTRQIWRNLETSEYIYVKINFI